MIDIETLQHTSEMIEKLAQGINPITNQKLPDEDCINNIEISRCLFKASSILLALYYDKTHPSDTKKKEHEETKDLRTNFHISEEQLNNFEFSEKPLCISVFTRRINDLVEDPSMKKLTYTTIQSYLIENGYLEEVYLENGKRIKQPTEKGLAIGIIKEDREDYSINLYSKPAQSFIINNLQTMIEIRNG